MKNPVVNCSDPTCEGGGYGDGCSCHDVINNSLAKEILSLPNMIVVELESGEARDYDH